VFKEGEPADHFFILIKGCVQVGIGETGQKLYYGSHIGEVYGLCALVDQPVYSASAVCSCDSELLGIDKQLFFKLLETHAENAVISYRRLSKVLGMRLIQSYKIISGSADNFSQPVET
jgi:CRP-like cAMP-binding protein